MDSTRLKPCPVCCKWFETRYSIQTHCSKACAGWWSQYHDQRARRWVTAWREAGRCEVCDLELLPRGVLPSGGHLKRFCSRDCSEYAHGNNLAARDRCRIPWRECRDCEAWFIGYWDRSAPTCRSCAAERRRARSRAKYAKYGDRRRLRPSNCGLCGAEILSPAGRRRRCDECRNARRSEPPTSCEIPWRECPWCGHWFVNRPKRKYCSKRCLDMMHPWRRRVQELEYGDCRRCGRCFVRRAGQLGEFCSDRCAKRERKARRRHVLRIAGPVETFTLREIAERDGWRCHLCGRNVPDRDYAARDNDPTLDHLIPVSDGGTHTRENVRLAHNRCNWERNTGGEVQLLLVG